MCTQDWPKLSIACLSSYFGPCACESVGVLIKMSARFFNKKFEQKYLEEAFVSLSF